MFRDIVEIFHSIKNESSKTGKEAILRANKDNKDFVKVLRFLYNPFELTGLKAKKLVKFAHFTSKDVKQFDTVLDAIDYIIVNNTGKDEDAMVISNLINTYDIDIHSPVHDFLQDLFTKDFKCGITATTINKVFGKGFIPKHSIMLAEKYEDFKDKVTGEFALTEKLDGVRCTVVKENGTIRFMTRKGHLIEGLELLFGNFTILPDNYVYDGELLINEDLPSKEMRKKTASLVKKKVANKDLNFHMFDMLPVKQFYEEKSNDTYKERMAEKKRLFETYNLDLDRIVDVEILYVGTDKSVIEPLLLDLIARGKEGLMLNKTNAYYVGKRNSNILKLKVFQEADLMITGYKEGKARSKYEGMLGSFIVDYKGYELECGSGYDDSERTEYWKNPEQYIGQIITVKYHEETSNEQGGLSVSFPTFEGFRDDKTEPSYN